MDKEIEDVNADIKAYEACLQRLEQEPYDILSETDFQKEKQKVIFLLHIYGLMITLIIKVRRWKLYCLIDILQAATSSSIWRPYLVHWPCYHVESHKMKSVLWCIQTYYEIIKHNLSAINTTSFKKNAAEFLRIRGTSPCYQSYGRFARNTFWNVWYSYKSYSYLCALQFQIEEEEKKLKAAIEEAEKLYSEVSSEMKDLEIKSKQFEELEERLVSVLDAIILL